jgi:hypothetical protein
MLLFQYLFYQITKNAVPQNSHENFMQQAYITMHLTYLAVFVLPNGTDMSYKPIPVIACVSFAVLPFFLLSQMIAL